MNATTTIEARKKAVNSLFTILIAVVCICGLVWMFASTFVHYSKTFGQSQPPPELAAEQAHALELLNLENEYKAKLLAQQREMMKLQAQLKEQLDIQSQIMDDLESATEAARIWKEKASAL